MTLLNYNCCTKVMERPSIKLDSRISIGAVNERQRHGWMVGI
jgi:hypothetical protein